MSFLRLLEKYLPASWELYVLLPCSPLPTIALEITFIHVKIEWLHSPKFLGQKLNNLPRFLFFLHLTYNPQEVLASAFVFQTSWDVFDKWPRRLAVKYQVYYTMKNCYGWLPELGYFLLLCIIRWKEGCNKHPVVPTKHPSFSQPHVWRFWRVHQSQHLNHSWITGVVTWLRPDQSGIPLFCQQRLVQVWAYYVREERFTSTIPWTSGYWGPFLSVTRENNVPVAADNIGTSWRER